MTPATDRSSFEAKASRIRLILLDVDGVLTDGTILLHPDGTESKQFHIRDGTGIVLAQRAGMLTGLLSARVSPATMTRAAQLGIRIVVQGVTSKLQAYKDILQAHELRDVDVCYMGDDLLDLTVLSRVGLSAAPADAVPQVRERVDWVAATGGGRGAVRQLVEEILRAQRRWDDLLADYLEDAHV
ncbi:MAG: HAD hydrolase family protein [Acidobacteria bacterium]|nr:HAD hydrolase family protein [Acidobacteriota bacterium]